MLLGSRGQSIYFGEEDLSISPVLFTEFPPCSKWINWQKTVDHELHELKRRTRNIEEHNRVLTRLVNNLRASMVQTSHKVPSMNGVLSYTQDQNESFTNTSEPETSFSQTSITSREGYNSSSREATSAKLGRPGRPTHNDSLSAPHTSKTQDFILLSQTKRRSSYRHRRYQSEDFVRRSPAKLPVTPDKNIGDRRVAALGKRKSERSERNLNKRLPTPSDGYSYNAHSGKKRSFDHLISAIGGSRAEKITGI